MSKKVRFFKKSSQQDTNKQFFSKGARETTKKISKMKFDI
jgi:hypothetical protein